MTIKNKFALAALAAAMGLSATAAQAETTSGDAYARIMRQLTIEKTADLQFGTIIVGNSDSTVQVGRSADNTNDTSVCGPNITCIGTRHTAKFNLQGSEGQSVIITLPLSSVQLTRESGPADSTGATEMTASLLASTNLVELTEGPGAGGGSFAVGGVLTVNAGQAEGAYKGTFAVEAVYQ